MYSEATLFNKQYHNIRVYRTKRNTFLGEIILWNSQQVEKKVYTNKKNIDKRLQTRKNNLSKKHGKTAKRKKKILKHGNTSQRKRTYKNMEKLHAKEVKKMSRQRRHLFLLCP